MGDCIQHICFVETKIRGVDQIHIAVTVGFTYVELNKLIYFIQNEEYKVRATSINDMSALVENNEIYRFYISGDTNLIPIVNAIIRDIKKYALDYLDSCNTMEKYRKELIERNEKVRLGIYGLKRPEWNLLALELLLNYDGYKKILEEYDDFLSKPVVEGTDEIGFDRIKRLGVTTLLIHEKWNKTQNYWRISEPTRKLAKKIVDECHKRGIKVIPYFGYELSTLSPDFSEYATSLRVSQTGLNGGGWYRKPNQRDYVVCFNSKYADDFAEGIKVVTVAHRVAVGGFRRQKIKRADYF